MSTASIIRAHCLLTVFRVGRWMCRQSMAALGDELRRVEASIGESA